MATKQNLSIIAGDSKSYNLTFSDATGTALDITGWIIYFTVKRTYADADVDAILSKTVTVHTDPTAGKTSIVLAHADTEGLPRGVYYYSIQAQTDVTNLYTVLRGQYTIEEVADRNS